jgi:hypothetical protein
VGKSVKEWPENHPVEEGKLRKQTKALVGVCRRTEEGDKKRGRERERDRQTETEKQRKKEKKKKTLGFMRGFYPTLPPYSRETFPQSLPDLIGSDVPSCIWHLPISFFQLDFASSYFNKLRQFDPSFDTVAQ